MSIIFKKYSWLFYVLVIILMSYFAAKTLAVIVGSKIRIEKKSPITVISVATNAKSELPAFEDYKIIMERNIFDSEDVIEDIPDDKPEAPPDPNAPAVRTSLPIKLVSTFVVGDGKDDRSSATIVGSGNKSGLSTYSIGDSESFAPNVKIVLITPDRVEFLNNQRKEFVDIEGFDEGKGGRTASIPPNLGLPSSSGAAKSDVGITQEDETTFVVERSELEKVKSNPVQFLRQARARDYKDPSGQVQGIEIRSLRPNSVFSKLGLQRRDIVEEINGETASMVKGFNLFNKLADADSFNIKVRRNGQELNLEYQIQ